MKLRRTWWHFWTWLFASLARACAGRKARHCPCAACYVFLNRDKIVADMVREMQGKPPVDRRAN